MKPGSEIQIWNPDLIPKKAAASTDAAAFQTAIPGL
jgi:hypothetical protein